MGKIKQDKTTFSQLMQINEEEKRFARTFQLFVQRAKTFFYRHHKKNAIDE